MRKIAAHCAVQEFIDAYWKLRKKIRKIKTLLVFLATAQESKRAFLHNIVNEEGEKGKLECFVNFCEDTIFEVHSNTVYLESRMWLFCLCW